MDKATLEVLTLQAKREILGMALDLRVEGDEVDRVGSTDKRTLLAAMQRVYIMLGSRFQYLVANLEIGVVDWGACGPWQVLPQTQSSVTLKLKNWAIGANEDKVVELCSDQLLGDAGPWKLSRPYSVRGASIVSVSSKDELG